MSNSSMGRLYTLSRHGGGFKRSVQPTFSTMEAGPKLLAECVLLALLQVHLL